MALQGDFTADVGTRTPRWQRCEVVAPNAANCTRWVPILAVAIACLLMLTSGQGRGQGYEIDCPGTLASLRLSHPSLNCSCPARNAQPVCSSGPSSGRTQSSSRSYGYDPSVAIGAAIFGSLLQGLMGDLFSVDDPQATARAEEAKRKAEEEARRRAEEERRRHQKMLASLTSLSTGGSPTLMLGGGTASAKPGLLALQQMDTPVRPGGGPPPAGDDEAARAWLADPDTMFGARWSPMPLDDKPLQPVIQPVCSQTAQGTRICKFPDDERVTGSVLSPPTPVRSESPPAVLDRSQMVGLLRNARNNNPLMRDPPVAIAYQLAAERPTVDRQSALYVLVNRLKDTGKVLVENGICTLAPLVSGGRVVLLLRDTYSLAQEDLEDATSAAGWLGSTRLSGAPERRSLIEQAAPFIETGPVLDTALLAEEIRRIWSSQP